jgi:uncharacterized membrane protein YbaN (DUF454 family)
MPPSVEEDAGSSAVTETTSIFSRRFYRVSRIALGIALLIAGLAGLVLPILQGVVLIVAALAILRKDIPWAATLWDRFVVPLQQRYRRWRKARRKCRQA